MGGLWPGPNFAFFGGVWCLHSVNLWSTLGQVCSGSLIELAAAGFSGLVTAGGRGGIDGGTNCFGDLGGGDFGGPIGSGVFRMDGGNGGCDVSALHLGFGELVQPRPFLFLCEVLQCASSWSWVACAPNLHA